MQGLLPAPQAAGRGRMPLPGHFYVQDRNNRACGQGRWRPQSSMAVYVLGAGEGGQTSGAYGSRCLLHGGLQTKPCWVFLPGPALPFPACTHRDALRLFHCQMWLGFYWRASSESLWSERPAKFRFMHERRKNFS